MLMMETYTLTINESICENPCKIFGIKNKGFIKEGFDADFTIVDMNKELKLKMKILKVNVAGHLLMDMNLKEHQYQQLLAGQIKMRDGKILGDPEGKPLKF